MGGGGGVRREGVVVVLLCEHEVRPLGIHIFIFLGTRGASSPNVLRLRLLCIHPVTLSTRLVVPAQLSTISFLPVRFNSGK